MPARVTYAIEWSCNIRRTLGDQALLDALGNRDLASPATAPLPDGRSPDLREWAKQCRRCPAHLDGVALGCLGRVALPLTRSDEQWLLGRLPHDLTTTAGCILASAIVDFGWDGGYAARLREADRERARRGEAPRYFACPEPCRRSSPSLEISSDQAFDMLFGEGHVAPGHTLLLALCFGLLPHDTPADQLALLSQDPATRHDALATMPSPGTTAP